MTEHTASRPPFSWVYKRDGRLVPFEADKISQSLFAATEILGSPDAFLARELTDGVLHFLAQEADGTIPTTGQVSEMVVKVVREFGQPALSQAYADHARRRTERIQAGEPSPQSATAEPAVASVLGRLAGEKMAPQSLAWRTAAACLRQYSLEKVFTRDLVSAHRAGLVVLGDLHAPLELAACVLGPFGDSRCGVLEAIQEARGLAGSAVAIDGPEYILAHLRPAAVPGYVRELDFSLRALGLRAVLNLNIGKPPAWAGDLATGPLFTDQHSTLEPELLATQAENLLDQLIRGSPMPRTGNSGGLSVFRVDWHLGERDFEGGAAGRLLRLARRAVAGAPLAFVFDRRKQIALAEGLDRRNPSVLMTIGLNLPQLAEQSGRRDDLVLILQKLGSLARLALSAGLQKREFLRRLAERRPELNARFFLERARLVVVPIGLDRTVRILRRGGMCHPPGLEAACQLVHHLREVLRLDGRASQLETCLDSVPGFRMDDEPDAEPNPPTLDRAAGLTAWEASASVSAQLRAAGELHIGAAGGTAAVLLPDRAVRAEEFREWLQLAWKKTAVNRLCFIRPQPSQQQLPVTWEKTASPA